MISNFERNRFQTHLKKTEAFNRLVDNVINFTAATTRDNLI